MREQLRASVHATAIGEDLVLLDLAADAYLCVPGGARAAALGFPARLPATTTLRQAGLLGREGGGETRPPPRLPEHGVRPLAGTVTPLEAVRLAAATLDLIWGYAGRPLPEIVRAVQRPSGPRLPEAETLRLAAVFARLAPWLPIPGKCLVRSFVLLRFLQRSGGGADWIFGVRTWPFGAHCWLQFGATALDDDPDRLAGYSPLLAVLA